MREGTEGRPGGHGIRAGAEGSPGSDLGSCSQRTCGISRAKAREKEAAGRGSPCALPAVGGEGPAAIRPPEPAQRSAVGLGGGQVMRRPVPRLAVFEKAAHPFQTS